MVLEQRVENRLLDAHHEMAESQQHLATKLTKSEFAEVNRLIRAARQIAYAEGFTAGIEWAEGEED